MKILYFDTIAGISGDMTNAALIHAGMPLEFLKDELKKISLDGYKIETETVVVNGITAIRFKVEIVKEIKHNHTHLNTIVNLIDSSSLSKRIKERAIKIFNTIGESEAKVHNIPIEKIHFHEVGAIDSIVDIVGSCIGLEFFNIDAIYSSPIKLGSGGTIKTDHGVMPIPAPATLEILKNYSVQLTEIPFELTTPTGAGIIKALSRGVLSNEEISINHIGFGAGTNQISQLPNLLRVAIGNIDSNFEQDEVIVLEANIDNLNPELFPFVIEKSLVNGALDAFYQPITMKKGRQGTLLTLIAPREKINLLQRLIFEETTTIGIRSYKVERKKLERSARTLKTSFGDTIVKIVVLDKKEKIVPEFEECKRISVEFKIPLKEVYARLEKELNLME